MTEITQGKNHIHLAFPLKEFHHFTTKRELKLSRKQLYIRLWSKKLVFRNDWAAENGSRKRRNNEMKDAQSCLTLCDPVDCRNSRSEYWSGLPFPSPGDFPNTGIKPRSHTAGRFFTSWAAREAQEYWSGEPIPSQWIFPNQELNRDLLHCRWILYQLSYQVSPGEAKGEAQKSWCQVSSNIWLTSELCMCRVRLQNSSRKWARRLRAAEIEIAAQCWGESFSSSPPKLEELGKHFRLPGKTPKRPHLKSKGHTLLGLRKKMKYAFRTKPKMKPLRSKWNTIDSTAS